MTTTEQTTRDAAGRFIGGVPRSKIDVSERFWPKVEIKGEDECWEWQGAISSDGYGSLNIDGKTVGSHRISYSLSIGRIPAGMHVCHHCDNRRCCNPKHFFVGTNNDNVADKVSKGRQAKGEIISTANLTEADVRSLRDEMRAGISLAFLVRRTGLPHCTVYSAVYGVTWKHVDGALTPPKMEFDLAGQTKTITARDLRDATATYVGMVGRGMTITITKDGLPIAVMAPPNN